MPLFIVLLLAVPNEASAELVLFSIKSDIFNSPSSALPSDNPNRSSIPDKIEILSYSIMLYLSTKLFTLAVQ